MVGTYLETIRPEKLVFTWSNAVTRGQETVVTVEFIERGSASFLEIVIISAKHKPYMSLLRVTY